MAQNKILSVANIIKKEIKAKKYPKGYRLETVRSFAIRFDVSANSIVKALEFLVNKKILYKEVRKGYFVNQEPKQALKIGYAGHIPNPSSVNFIRNNAVSELFDFLIACEEEVVLITRNDLKNPTLAKQKLKNLDVLICAYSFTDDAIRNINFLFKAKIVIIDSKGIIEDINCSQVLENIYFAMDEFRRTYDLNTYDRFLIISPDIENQHVNRKKCIEILTQWGYKDKIECKIMPEMTTYNAGTLGLKYFLSEKEEDYKNTLVISISGYFSHGIYEAKSINGWIPDILSIDNAERYLPNFNFEQSYFTAIDPQKSECYIEAAKLAIKVGREKENKQYIIKMPAKLVLRKSINEKRKINKREDYEV